MTHEQTELERLAETILALPKRKTTLLIMGSEYHVGNRFHVEPLQSIVREWQLAKQYQRDVIADWVGDEKENDDDTN